MSDSKQFVSIYDTTLRDGTQGEGVSFSKVDKVRIAKALDSFGVAYIEGGWPGSNPKDMAFFEAARDLELETAKVAAFGSTRRASNKVADDANVQTLLAAATPVVTIFGKSWLLHVSDVLRITPEANLEMIGDTCAYLKEHDREVIYDAEHFFDGYKHDNDYALSTLSKAAANGATTIVLCDTNGGTMPSEIRHITARVIETLGGAAEVGIHTHNDGGLAVANAVAAVNIGATHVQGTINGIGERCGNVDLCTVMPTLELKMGMQCLPEGQLSHLAELSRFVYDLANIKPDNKLPYVGSSAFAHKGGMHVNAVQKNVSTYEHVVPESVGNKRRILVSDLAGGSNILMAAAEHNLDLDSKGPEVRQILTELKQLENEGYEFEAAGASFELLMQKVLQKHEPYFNLDGFRVIVEKRGHDDPCVTEATVKVTVNDETEIMAAEGDGPVNALDTALRKALTRFYPDISSVSLRDYKVRILDGDRGTEAKTRVLIESTDGHDFWGTVGVSENIIEASWQALVDSVEYVLYRKK
jgi:2-isopropylmalate synthase